MEQETVTPLSEGTYVLVADEWVEGTPSTGDRYKVVDNKGGTFESVYVEPAETTLGTKLSRLKFKQRMTADERIVVRAAADTDPIVFDFMDLVSDATYIDLSLPETIQGVQYLEQQGHLAAGRADEILNTPVTPEEQYGGI